MDCQERQEPAVLALSVEGFIYLQPERPERPELMDLAAAAEAEAALSAEFPMIVCLDYPQTGTVPEQVAAAEAKAASLHLADREAPEAVALLLFI